MDGTPKTPCSGSGRGQLHEQTLIFRGYCTERALHSGWNRTPGPCSEVM